MSLNNAATFKSGVQEAVHLSRDGLFSNDQRNSPAQSGVLPANSSQTGGVSHRFSQRVCA